MAKLIFPLQFIKMSEDEAIQCERIVENTSGYIAKRLNKRVSLPISIYMARLKIHPNVITFVNLLLGLWAAYLATKGTYGYLAAAGLLFQFVSIADGIDGEVAKINKKSSAFGAWFDTFGDNLSLFAFLFGVGFGIYQQQQSPWIIFALLVAILGVSTMVVIMLVYLIRNGSAGSLVYYEKEVVLKYFSKNSFAYKILFAVRTVVKKDVFALAFCLLTLVHLASWIIYFTSLFSMVAAIFLLFITLQPKRDKQESLA